MKKLLLITSHLIVAVISGFVSIVGYNYFLHNRVIDNYIQLELREQELELKFRKEKMAVDIEKANNELAERANKVAYEKALQDIRQREREADIAKRLNSRAFTQ